MAQKTKLHMDKYYFYLAIEEIRKGTIGCDWEVITIPTGDASTRAVGWAIPRKGGIDLDEAGFWLNVPNPNVESRGGTFELRLNPDLTTYSIRNTKGHFRWYDRIDTNPNSNDSLGFEILETLNVICEWLTGADFPVEIDWQDNREDVRAISP